VFFSLCQYDLKLFWLAEFHHHLPADSAGRGIIHQFSLRSPYNTDSFKFFYSFPDSFKKRRSFRTVCRSTSCILNVTGWVDLSVCSKECMPYLKMRVWRIRIGKLSDGCTHQFPDLCFLHNGPPLLLCLLICFDQISYCLYRHPDGHIRVMDYRV